MTQTVESPNQPLESFSDQVRTAVIWRSGTQIFSQILTWTSTFLVIRILSPSDYGLFAMTQVILVLLNLLNGYGLASGYIQRRDASIADARQLLGMLIAVNLTLGVIQFLAAPLAAAYYRQPIVTDLLRVQALLFIATPFSAYGHAVLCRRMDFKGQAIANLGSALAGGGTALACALSGWGIWTLIAAPIALFGTHATISMIAANQWVRPSFNFAGSGAMAKYGALIATSQFFWFLQSQADVVIAGRVLDPHTLGLYTTSLFLTQIFVSKFVPPLNEVAFSAYARIQEDKAAVASGFARSVRLILLVGAPIYLGMFAVADPMVAVVLGDQWLAVADIIRIIAFAMPFMTVQVLFSPATDAMGRPDISVGNGALAALVFPLCFLAGIQFGVTGLAASWLVAHPLYLAWCARRSLPVIGLSARALLAAVAPPLLAATAMAAAVVLIDRATGIADPLPRLLTLIGCGAAAYAAWLALFARDTLADAITLVLNRKPGV
ncbi:lipopolysaccharide biosynthesis protein [Sphingomonas sp. CJ99]